jgi:hypothetical protein
MPDWPSYPTCIIPIEDRLSLVYAMDRYAQMLRHSPPGRYIAVQAKRNGSQQSNKRVVNHPWVCSGCWLRSLVLAIVCFQEVCNDQNNSWTVVHVSVLAWFVLGYKCSVNRVQVPPALGMCKVALGNFTNKVSPFLTCRRSQNSCI